MAVNRAQIKDPSRRRRLEGQVFDITVTFLDGDTPVDPAYFYWRVDNLETGGPIQGWQSVVTSGATHTLEVPAAATKIYSPELALERRQLLIAGPSKNILTSYKWDVENLVGFNVGDELPAAPVLPFPDGDGLLTESGDVFLTESGEELALESS